MHLEYREETKLENPIVLLDGTDAAIDRLYGYAPETAHNALLQVKTFSSEIASLVYGNKKEHRDVTAVVGDYVKALQVICEDEALWSALPEYIPPAQNTIDYINAFLAEPDQFLARDATQSDIAQAVTSAREKLQGNPKTSERTRLKKVLSQMHQWMLHGWNPTATSYDSEGFAKSAPQKLN